MRRFVTIGLVLASGWRAASAQDGSRDRPADRAMATRAELERLAAGGEPALAALAHQRLAHGDFRPGDRVWISVQGDTALTDTFTVAADTTLHLKSPTVGVLTLDGVLRSELEEATQRYIAQFIVHPVVRAEPLLRLSIQGAVVHAGFYHVAVNAPIGDAVMAAGGTTPDALMSKARVRRSDVTVLEGHALQAAIANGLTVDAADLHDGDQIEIPERRPSGFLSGINLMWALVSIAGGVYALSKAFH